MTIHDFIDVFRNSIYITGLVIIMMLVIEHLNVSGKGQFGKIKQSPFRQVLIGATLGLIPGCMGGFLAVSLFSHNIFGFGALLAAMISDTGDETFVMFAALPIQTALFIKLILFSLALLFGYLATKYVKINFHFDHQLEIHSHDHQRHAKTSILYNLKHLTWSRAWVSCGIIVFIFSLAFGLLEHDHSAHELPKVDGVEECIHDHESHEGHDHEEHDHEISEMAHEHPATQHQHTGNFFFSERWLNLLFVLVAIAGLWIVLSAEKHFLEEHIIHHVIAKHFAQIFAWTFGSLLLIAYLSSFVGFDEWIHDNPLILLLIAICVGIIPQSGPHIVFISLFLSGQIGLSVLLANSIVQNGHSGLPLLASSKKGFLIVKLCCIAIALTIGLLGYVFGF